MAHAGQIKCMTIAEVQGRGDVRGDWPDPRASVPRILCSRFLTGMTRIGHLNLSI
jgi:hypothetical protein